jgi:pimeloyl-ACP methyl ester carboxylesterase
MKLHYEIEDNGQDKVVIFFGWQGSTPRYRSKYLQLWKELGYNCIGTGMRFDHMFLPPSLLQKRAANLCQILRERKWDKMTIIIHSCSNGGMHNTMAFVNAIQNVDEYRYISDNVKGIVLDSAPAKQDWTTFSTLARVNFSPILAALLQLVLALFILAGKLMKPIIGQNAVSDFTEWVHGRITRCLASFKHVPMLFLYSKKDALANYRYVDEMITLLNAHGAKMIRSKRWEDTDHVGHYRQRPEEYKNEIVAFLKHVDHL